MKIININRRCKLDNNYTMNFQLALGRYREKIRPF